MDFSKPRVAIYYDVLPSTGMRNDGAPLFMSYNFRKILNGKVEINNDSDNVVHLSPINPTAQHGTFDLNVLVDYGEDNLSIPLDWKIPSPNVYWAFDTHIDEKGFKYRLERARQFDRVYLCHKAQINDFIRAGISPERISYLPVAAEPDSYRPYAVMEKWDWCFIGHLNSEHRIDLVQRFVTEFGLDEDKGYLGWRMPGILGHCILDDAAKKYSKSRLAINDSIKDDLNMRTFEVMACRTCLVTQANEPLLELFKDGEHLVTFKTIDEAVELARGLLRDQERRKAIAKNGYEEILAKHTYRHRALKILKECLNWEPKEVSLAGAL